MLVFDHFSSIDPIIIKIQQQKWHINDYNFNNKNKIKRVTENKLTSIFGFLNQNKEIA